MRASSSLFIHSLVSGCLTLREIMESVPSASSKYSRFSYVLMMLTTSYLHSLIALFLISSSIFRVFSISTKAADHLTARAGFWLSNREFLRDLSSLGTSFLPIKELRPIEKILSMDGSFLIILDWSPIFYNLSIILGGTITAPEKGGPLKNFEPVNRVIAPFSMYLLRVLFSILPWQASTTKKPPYFWVMVLISSLNSWTIPVLEPQTWWTSGTV